MNFRTFFFRGRTSRKDILALYGPKQIYMGFVGYISSSNFEATGNKRL